MPAGKLTLLIISATVFATALLTGPPSFDSVDGAEFAVAGSRLEIAHAPGYPLFLLLIRTATILFSPLYGHLRLINCMIGAMILPVSVMAMKKSGISFTPSVFAGLLFIFSAPVMAQLNSLEVYPLAMLLAFSAIASKRTGLNGYATGMAVFAGHPVSALCLSLMTTGTRRWKSFLMAALLPASLFLYIPLRSMGSTVAHYGHPSSLGEIAAYFSMHSGRIAIPSPDRLLEALSSLGFITGAVILALAAFGGKLKPRQDLPLLFSLLFLASYELPDPAGQMWIFLLPVSIRCAGGMERIIRNSGIPRWVMLIPVLLSAVSGTVMSNRSQDDIAMRWTIDTMSQIQPRAIYRTVAHDAFYAAYAVHVLGFRSDIILSDPFGNYFELLIPPPVPPVIGDRTVNISRAWDRVDAFELKGLIFQPAGTEPVEPDWDGMEVFHFSGSSPDPMALDLAAEAWARRMIQETDMRMRDSSYTRAMNFASTEMTRDRIEDLRNYR